MLNAYFEDYNQEENTNFEGKSKKSTGKLKVSILKEKLVDSVDKNYQNDLVKASKVKQIINPLPPPPPVENNLRKYMHCPQILESSEVTRSS